MFRGGIWLTEGNAPIKEQLQLCLHGVCSRFHYHEVAFRKRLQLVRRHQGPFYHLQALAGIVFSFADRAAQYRAVAQRFRELLRRLTVGREATEDRVLAIIND